MEDVIIRSAVFVFIIIITVILKYRHFFLSRDMTVMSKIFLYLTLPSLIISNFSKLTFDVSLLWLIGWGMGLNVMCVAFAYFLPAAERGRRAFNVLNLSGYNIGGFVMPFLFSFAGPMGVVGASLFDVGNSIMCTGFTYTLAEQIKYQRSSSFSPLYFLRRLLYSPAFDAYLLMIILYFLDIKLPPFVIELTDVAGRANTLVTLLMIGMAVRLSFDKSQLKDIFRLNLLRLLLAVMGSIIVYYFAPFTQEIKHVLIITLFSPMTFMSTAFTMSLKEDAGTSGSACSVSIVISIVISTLLILYMGI